MTCNHVFRMPMGESVEKITGDEFYAVVEGHRWMAVVKSVLRKVVKVVQLQAGLHITTFDRLSVQENKTKASVGMKPQPSSVECFAVFLDAARF